LSREKLIAAAVAIFALFVAMVLPKFVDGENHGSVSLSSGLRYVISHPFHTLQALLASMGQPFAPWMSENSLRVGVAYGTVIAVVLLLLLIEAVRSGGLRKLVSDLDSNPLLWIGIIFIFTLVVGRLGSLGPVGVIEPRYTTGSLLVWLGTLAYLWQSSKAQRFRYWVAALCLCSGVWVNWSVGRYGLDYLRYQSAQSEKFVGCLAGPQSPGFEACRDLLYPGDWLGREFYNKYLRVLQVEKKAVFQSE
jgi:hypothetical protein